MGLGANLVLNGAITDGHPAVLLALDLSLCNTFVNKQTARVTMASALKILVVRRYKKVELWNFVNMVA